MDFKIAVIKGDGVGPEIVDEGLKVLDKIAQKYNHKFECTNVLGGGAAIDVTGEPLPKESLDICKASDAVLLGAVGGPKWDNIESSKRPEKGLLALRSGLGLFVNLRPATMHESIKEASPLRADIVEKGVDFVVVRELTGLGLKEAKALVDGAPGTIKEAVAKEDAEAMKAKLEEAGAKVELK